jgi:hypothetical protein
LSTIAIDNARTNERLSAFMSRIETTEPVDNIFVDLPLFNELFKRKETIDGGRQSLISVDTAVNSTINSFSTYDTFDTTPQDTAKSVVFAYINYGGTVSISWEELREVANSDVRIFDLLKHKRNNAVKSMKDRINSDLLVATPAAGEVNSLPFIVTTTGTVGGVDSTTETWWQSQESTAVGAFTANGLSSMRTLYNDIVRQGQGAPDSIITTQAIQEAFESELDQDVRYSDPSKLTRGAKMLDWKGMPVMFDNDVTAGELYMLNYDWISLKVDVDGAMDIDPFVKPADQKASVATFAFRGQLITTNRRGLGRLTGIT